VIKLINIAELSHNILNEFKNPNIAIDMTCGNGLDTLFLSSIAKSVFAFDIQDEAINNTKKLLDLNRIKNARVIKESHDLYDIYVSDKIDLVIYNLGYLPSGNKLIKTESRIVINSLKKILYQLNDFGIIVIVIYLHNLDESNQIQELTKKLGKEFDVMKYEVLNKNNSPYIIKIQKI